MKAECSYCSVEFEIRSGHYNRAMKEGHRVYCSKAHSRLGKRNKYDKTKQCIECKNIIDISLFRVRIKMGLSYVINRCRKCECSYNKKHRSQEKRRISERKRFSSPVRRENKNEFQKKWRSKNIIKNRKYHSKHIKKHVDIISDSYIVRNHFRGSKVSEIPKHLIEAFRQIIKNKRLIKLKNKQNENRKRPKNRNDFRI